MGDKRKIDAQRDADRATSGPGPGDEEWERNREVIHGEAEEQTVFQSDEDGEDKK